MSKMNRRDLLKIGFFGASATFGSQSFPAAPAQIKKQHDCIVLGAGVSGLTAATFLQKAGKSVLVLEGSERLGGRIHTHYDFVNGPIEAGAEFIHRAPGTVPLWNELNSLNLGTQTLSKVGNALLFYEPWKSGRKSVIDAALNWNILNAITIFSNIDNYKGPNISAGQWLDYQGYKSQIDRDFLGMVLTGHFPGTLNDLSIKGFGSDQLSSQLSEWGEYYITSGYGSLVRGLAKPIQIERNELVVSIEKSETGVTVRTRGGAVHKADTAICSFSIGMLKSGRVEFKPKLTSIKTEALKNIKMGYLGKLSLHFKERFWPVNMPMLQRPDQQRKFTRTYFHPFCNQPNMPAVLTGLIVGVDGARTTHLSDEDAIRAMCSDLDDIFPEARPVYARLARRTNGRPSYLRTQWNNNPFSLGGNSYLAVGGSATLDVTQSRLALASPDMAPVFFAGEAASVGTQPGSVHGAHFAGLQAAMQTYEYLQQGTKQQMATTLDWIRKTYPLKL